MEKDKEWKKRGELNVFERLFFLPQSWAFVSRSWDIFVLPEIPGKVLVFKTISSLRYVHGWIMWRVTRPTKTTVISYKLISIQYQVSSSIEQLVYEEQVLKCFWIYFGNKKLLLKIPLIKFSWKTKLGCVGGGGERECV